MGAVTAELLGRDWDPQAWKDMANNYLTKHFKTQQKVLQRLSINRKRKATGKQTKKKFFLLE